ncbi:CDC68-like protein [Rhynchospora pubera]|uniref:CDC68-like protein n=1 Tax=Rhynchospora pubera TaxID=906938 RepID=A0AAV8F5I9_9POAL|nr:CDC68-like protein [Rhynchospora pubera]
MTSTQDWANLSTDLVKRIGALLLDDDVTEYVRLRGVCRSWRFCTEDPKNLGGRFHPHKWIMITPLTSPPTAAFNFFKLSSGKIFSIDLLELRRGYSLVYVVDGLCLLQNKQTRVLALLNPFTRFLTNLPNQVTYHNFQRSPFVLEHAPGTLSGVYITSSSTVLLRFDTGDWKDRIRLVYAKPGDPVWLSIEVKIKFSDSILYRDEFYVIDVEKGLVRINFDREINSQTPVMDVVVPHGPSLLPVKESHLVECDGKIILVAVPKMFQVDLEERRLVPIELINGYALFLASQRSLSIDCKNLPCSHDNYIYFCESNYGINMILVWRSDQNVLNEGLYGEQSKESLDLQYVRLEPGTELKYSSTSDSDPFKDCWLVKDLVRYQKLRSLHNHIGWRAYVSK